MAANNASKITKALSKIVPPSVGSPKKSIRSTPSPKAQTTSGTVFKKPTEVPKRLVSKPVKEVKTEEPGRLVSNTVKKVNATLAVQTPTRRPPSIPLSPWNADHSKLVRSVSKTEAAVGGAKKKVTTPIPKLSKSAASKRNVLSNTTNKSQSSNTTKRICNNGQTTRTTRNVPAIVVESSNTTGEMKIPTSVKTVKPKTVTKPVSPSTESSSTQNDTSPSYSATLAALQGELNVVNETIRSVRQLKAYNIPIFGENDEKIEKNRSSDKTLLMSENAGKENTSPTYSMDNTYVDLNESYLPDSDKINSLDKSETISDINDLRVSPGIRNNHSPFTASSVDKLSNTVVPKSSPRVRRSLDGISSPRLSLAGNCDKSWSPFGQPCPRVFERQYVDLADNLFAPYITDDDSASAVRSPRYSF